MIQFKRQQNDPDNAFFIYHVMKCTKKYTFFSIYINDENILVVETRLLSAVLQYDLKNILSVKVSIVRKIKMCGLCE